MFFYGPFHPDKQVLGDQLELIYISSVQTQDVAWKTYQKWRMIETNGERGSGKSVLMAWHNDDDDDDRGGEEWAPSGYSCTKDGTWVMPHK